MQDQLRYSVTIQEIDPEIETLLMKGEQIILVASQARIAPGGSPLTPDKIYVTNMRVLYKNPRALGLKARINDIAYKDISNVELKRGVFSTEIQLIVRFLSKPEKLPAVDKKTAQQVNLLIQKGIRGELPGQIIAEDNNRPVQAKEHTDPLNELEKLGALREKGIITEQEFWKLKAELIKKF
jgi:hypothetical protein